MSFRPLRRSSNRHRFALPNQVWTWKLKPPVFAALAYLVWTQSHGGDTAERTAGALAVRLSMSTARASACLEELLRRGFASGDFTPAFPCIGREKGRFFTLPNEIFCLGLGHGVVTVYAYLLCCEERRTHQCHPSYSSISSATGLAVNTVMKHIGKLADRQFITVEHTSYLDRRGMKWNGNNCYTILPIRIAVEAFHQKQMEKLEEAVEQQQLTEFRMTRH